MLAYILAVLVGTGSVSLYLAAFVLPEIHRKYDFIWSGVGFFYALALWIYARQISGGILVGQTASVALLGWFGWQTLKLRRQLVPVERQTPLPTTTKLKEQLGLKQSQPTTVKPTTKTPPTAKPAQPAVINRSKPVDVNLPVSNNPVTPAATETDDEAWIKLEVKPSPTTSTGATVKPSTPPPAVSKPLGDAVRPPVPPPQIKTDSTSIVEPTITAETVSPNAPTDAIQTKAQLDAEE